MATVGQLRNTEAIIMSRNVENATTLIRIPRTAHAELRRLAEANVPRLTLGQMVVQLISQAAQKKPRR